MGWLATLLVAGLLGAWMWGYRDRLLRAERECSRLAKALREVRDKRDAEAALARAKTRQGGPSGHTT